MISKSRTADRAYLTLSVCIGGRPRTFALKRHLAFAVAAIVLMTVICSLGTGSYVLFHDELLASLMTRQADMQYAYEDRIATLRVALDRETSLDLVDRRTIETALHDLEARSAQLEVRAVTIDKLVTEAAPSAAAAARIRGSRRASTLDPDTGKVREQIDGGLADPIEPGSPSTGLRSVVPARDGGHADLGAAAAISVRLAQIEATQKKTVLGLREPLLRAAHRLASALADTGLQRTRYATQVTRDLPRDVGGPFVPLDNDNSAGFDVQVALLRAAIEQHDRLTSIVDRVPLRDPLDGPIEVSSGFGARLDPFLGRPAMHTGIDLREAYGDIVHATAAGTVTAAGPAGGYGNMVEIDHGNGLVTRYAHLSAIEVTVHQHVAAGAAVGRVGATGRATGPHLHYETRIDGEPVDPTRFLKAGAGLVRTAEN